MSRFEEVGEVAESVQAVATQEEVVRRSAKKEKSKARLDELTQEDVDLRGEGGKEQEKGNELRREQADLRQKIREIEKEIKDAENNPDLQKHVSELEEAKRVYEEKMEEARGEIEGLKGQEAESDEQEAESDRKTSSIRKRIKKSAEEASGIMGARGTAHFDEKTRTWTKGWMKEGIGRIEEEANKIKETCEAYRGKGKNVVENFWRWVEQDFIKRRDRRSDNLEEPTILAERFNDPKYVEDINIEKDAKDFFGNAYPYPNSYFMNVMLTEAIKNLQNPPDYIPKELAEKCLNLGSIKILAGGGGPEIVFLSGGKIADNVEVKPEDDPVVNSRWLNKDYLNEGELSAVRTSIESDDRNIARHPNWNEIINKANYNEEVAVAVTEEAIEINREIDAKNMAERQREIAERKNELEPRLGEVEKELEHLREIKKLVEEEIRTDNLGLIKVQNENIKSAEDAKVFHEKEVADFQTQYDSLPKKFGGRIPGIGSFGGGFKEPRTAEYLMNKIKTGKDDISSSEASIQSARKKLEEVTGAREAFLQKMKGLDPEGNLVEAEKVGKDYYLHHSNLEKQSSSLEREYQTLVRALSKIKKAEEEYATNKNLNIPLAEMQAFLENREQEKRKKR